MFLFGAPGVGKGTFAKMLHKDLTYNHISTGDQLRKILKGTAPTTFSPALVNEIKDIVKKGGLVGDDIVVGIIKEKMKEQASKKGVILDGFPRTHSQMVAYDKVFPTHLVVNLTLRKDILLEKLMARRTCVKCGAGYNVCNINRDGYNMEPLRPKKDGVCDHCGDKLVIREDDTQKVIESRMVEYDSKTQPLIAEFQKKKVLMNFEIKTGVNDYPSLFAQVKAKLGL